MLNQKGFATVMGLLVALIIILALASAVFNSSNYSQNNYLGGSENIYNNQQIQNPIVRVQTNEPYSQSYYNLYGQNPGQACLNIGGYWYSNTNTCAGNIDENKCSLAGGKINGCDSSCRYAGSRTCYPTCEITCTFNGSYTVTNQQYYTNVRVPVTDQISCSARLPSGLWSSNVCTSSNTTEQNCILAGGMYHPVLPCPTGYSCDTWGHFPTCTISAGY